MNTSRGQQIAANEIPDAAGLNRLFPSPPNGCLAIAIAKNAADATILKLIVAGIQSAISIPVTTGERSNRFRRLPRSRVQTASVRTAVSTDTPQTTSARNP